MEKSIEAIWKEGFVDDDALLAPKINDLYNQKSMHLIDKLIRMFRINLVCIVVFAAVFLPVTILLHIPIIGFGMAVLLAWLVVVGKRHMRLLEQIDKGVSSYDYLKTFQQWIKDKIAIYTRIYKVFYPALFLVMVFGFRFSPLGEKVMGKVVAEFPGVEIVLGLPLYALVGVVVLTGLLAYCAEGLYRWDLNIVYGRQYAKLDEIIADMEELRGN